MLLHSPLIIFFNQFQKRAIKTEPRTFTFIHSIQPQIDLLSDSEHLYSLPIQTVVELSV